MERLVCKQLSSFFERNNVLHSTFSGFRPKHSTATLLQRVTDDILVNMYTKKISCLLMLDLSKAFDSVNHAILLQKLQRYNIHPTTISWFKNYLTDRTQCVKLDSYTSNHIPVKTGVPQGSVCGPLLFSLYINDLPLWLQSNTPMYGYADDINILKAAPISNLDALHDELIDEINNLTTWFHSNSLKPNISKYQFMLLGTRQQLQKIPDHIKTLSTRDHVIQATTSATCLGLRLDPELKWSNHIAYLRRACGYRLITLARARRCIPEKIRKNIITATVFSLLDYCDTVYSNCSITLKCSLQRIINFAVRIQCGLKKSEHVTTARLRLDWPTIQERHNHNFNKLVKKCIINKVPSYLSELISTNDTFHQYNTRTKFHIPKAHSRSFRYRASIAANSS